MLTYYQCKSENFKIHELVDPVIVSRYGEFAWSFFKPQALMMLDAIKDFYQTSVTVNNWTWGGNFQWRGLRTSRCKEGGEMSQHRLGGAFDLDVRGVSPSKVRKDIIDNKDGVFHLITRLEVTLNGKEINWVHFDCANVPERIVLLHV